MTLYLDTTSLVKLYVEEAGSAAVRDLVTASDVVGTSMIAYAEARAAFARRRREGALRPSDLRSVKAAFEADWPRYLALDVTPDVCREAGGLAERYRLRAYDAMHLATFSELARAVSPGRVRFSTFDAPLDRAARALIRTLRTRALTGSSQTRARA